MSKTRSSDNQHSDTAGDALQKLLRLEGEVQTRLRETRARAQAMVAQAEADAQSRRVNGEEESRRATLVVEAREVARVDQECKRIDASAAATVAAIDGLPDASVRKLAQQVVARLVEGDTRHPRAVAT